jgi:Domain of unknown function (DUF1816)
MNEFLTSLLDAIGFAWWIEVTTENPRCTYYFGPFLNQTTAQVHQGGYVEDLESEGAQSIVATVRRCKPNVLTIYDEKVDRFPISTIFSSQF